MESDPTIDPNYFLGAGLIGLVIGLVIYLAVLGLMLWIGYLIIKAAVRNGLVLFALWRGLAAYASWTEKRFLLGCSSLTSQDPRDGWRMLARLRAEGHVHPELFVAARPAYDCGAGGQEPAGEPGAGIEVPRLFRTYLRFGAKACSQPALDREFKTIGFLMLIDLDALAPRVRALFFAGLPDGGGPDAA